MPVIANIHFHIHSDMQIKVKLLSCLYVCMYVLSTFGEFKYLFDEQCNFCVLLLENSTLKMQF